MSEATEKPCTKCGTVKPLADFFPRYGKNCQGKVGSWCKKCHTAANMLYARTSRKCNENRADYSRRRKYASVYGITVEQYEDLLIQQDGVCAVCKCKNTSSKNKKWGDGPARLAVDHDHETGQVRGLLCDQCNRAIGLLKDNKELLYAAYDYLLKAEKGQEGSPTSVGGDLW